MLFCFTYYNIVNVFVFVNLFKKKIFIIYKKAHGIWTLPRVFLIYWNKIILFC